MSNGPEIYVGNFPTTFTAENLLSLFQDYQGVRIRSFKKEDQKCFAFLVCRNERQLIDIVTTMHDIDVCKRNLIVRAKDRDLQKQLEETFNSNEGLKEENQSNRSPNAANKTVCSENSIDDIVDKFPSAIRFKNPRLQTPCQENIPQLQTPSQERVSRLQTPSRVNIPQSQTQTQENISQVQNPSQRNIPLVQSPFQGNIPQVQSPTQGNIPQVKTPPQVDIRSPATNEPKWKILAQYASPLSNTCDKAVNSSDNCEIKLSFANSAEGKYTPVNHSHLQSVQKEAASNTNQMPKLTPKCSIANSDFVSPENNPVQHQEPITPKSATNMNMGQQNQANRGRGQNSNRGRGQNGRRGNTKNFPYNPKNLPQQPNDAKYQRSGDYTAIAQHHNSTLNFSPSQPNDGSSSFVVPKLSNNSQAKYDSNSKTPVRQQHCGNKGNSPFYDARQQKGFDDVVQKGHHGQEQSVSTQNNCSVFKGNSFQHSMLNSSASETIPKKLYSDVNCPVGQHQNNVFNQEDKFSDTCSHTTENSQHNFQRRTLLASPPFETTGKSMIERGQNLHQKQKRCNKIKRRQSAESYQNSEIGSRASSSLGSYEGEDISTENLHYLSVVNFPFETSRKDLYDLFEDFEPCIIVMICNFPLRNRRPTEAILGFKSEDQVTNAILNIDNTDYEGRILIVTDAVDMDLLSELMTISPKKNHGRKGSSKTHA